MNNNSQPLTGPEWYQSLQHPEWAPELMTIDLVWRILIQILLVTFGYVFVAYMRKELPGTTAKPFLINFIANMLFTPLQFDLRILPITAIDAIVVWATIPWMMSAMWPHHKWVSIAQIPYFLWVSVIAVLQLQLAWMNA